MCQTLPNPIRIFPGLWHIPSSTHVKYPDSTYTSHQKWPQIYPDLHIHSPQISKFSPDWGWYILVGFRGSWYKKGHCRSSKTEPFLLSESVIVLLVFTWCRLFSIAVILTRYPHGYEHTYLKWFYLVSFERIDITSASVVLHLVDDRGMCCGQGPSVVDSSVQRMQCVQTLMSAL